MRGHRQDAWQAAAMTAGRRQKLGTDREGVRPESQRQPGPAGTLIWGFWPPEPPVALRRSAGGHSLGRLGPSSSYNPKGGRAKGVPEPRPGLAPLAPTPALWSHAGPPTPCVCPSSGGPERGREGGAGWGRCKSSPTLPQSWDGGNLNTAFPSR